jgi:carboxyl-terminal processing protease
MEMHPDGRIEIFRVLADSPAEAIGVEVGDILVAVDGENIRGLSTEAVSALITNPDHPRVEITVQRDTRTLTFDILKGEIANPTVRVDRLEQRPEAQGLANQDRYRIVRITGVGANTANDLRQAISYMQNEGVRGIIIDLRGNGGGYLDVTVDIANQIVPTGTVLQTVNQAGRRRTYTSVLDEVPFENVVVLINRFTASAAEVIASALQDADAAILVGETTFGKGSVQTVYALRDGGVFKLTTEIYFRRNGEAINGIGVIPDIEIARNQTIGGPDNVLRRGLEELMGR